MASRQMCAASEFTQHIQVDGRVAGGVAGERYQRGAGEQRADGERSAWSMTLRARSANRRTSASGITVSAVRPHVAAQSNHASAASHADNEAGRARQYSRTALGAMNPSADAATDGSTSPSTPARPLTQNPNRPEATSSSSAARAAVAGDTIHARPNSRIGLPVAWATSIVVMVVIQVDVSSVHLQADGSLYSSSSA